MDLISSPAAAATAPRLRALWSRLKPRRKPRPERAPDTSPAAELSGLLRAFRAAALWGVAALIATATGSAFTESYRGLYLWALHHNFSGFWAAAFPLQVDLFIAVGELVLFIAMLDAWRRRDQAGAWLVALAGLAVSVAGNVGHIAAHDLQSRGTAAVPPVAAFGALWLGLGVLKRVLRRRPEAVPRAARVAQPEAVAITEAGRPAGTYPLIVPADAEHAARMAMEATARAGNPLSGRQLEMRFGLTRGQAARVREAAGVTEPAPAPSLHLKDGMHAGMNGSGS